MQNYRREYSPTATAANLILELQMKDFLACHFQSYSIVVGMGFAITMSKSYCSFITLRNYLDFVGHHIAAVGMVVTECQIAPCCFSLAPNSHLIQIHHPCCSARNLFQINFRMGSELFVEALRYRIVVAVNFTSCLRLHMALA
jgi:hypothetical protein